MKVTITDPPPLTEDPYETDICGSRPGQTLTVQCDSDLVITIKESKSGIGSEYHLTATGNGHTSQDYVIYIDDDGSLVAEVSRR